MSSYYRERSPSPGRRGGGEPRSREYYGSSSSSYRSSGSYSSSSGGSSSSEQRERGGDYSYAPPSDRIPLEGGSSGSLRESGSSSSMGSGRGGFRSRSPPHHHSSRDRGPPYPPSHYSTYSSYPPRGGGGPPGGGHHYATATKHYASGMDIRDSTTLFIGGLPYHFRARDLAEILERCGPLRNVTVGINKRTGESKGYAFVEFEYRRDAEDAFDRFNGYLVAGRRLRLDWDVGLGKKQQYYGYNEAGGREAGGRGAGRGGTGGGEPPSAGGRGGYPTSSSSGSHGYGYGSGSGSGSYYREGERSGRGGERSASGAERSERTSTGSAGGALTPPTRSPPIGHSSPTASGNGSSNSAVSTEEKEGRENEERENEENHLNTEGESHGRLRRSSLSPPISRRGRTPPAQGGHGRD